jgi:hypothetical protein
LALNDREALYQKVIGSTWKEGIVGLEVYKFVLFLLFPEINNFTIIRVI